MSRLLRVAIVPAAGMGTRMRPASEAVPKELLPVGGRPAIDWVLEEAWSCGIDRVIVVTSPEKTVLSEYLMSHYRHGMQPSGRYGKPASAGPDASAFEVRLVEQRVPSGLGDAVRTGWESVTAEAVAVLLPDELVFGGSPPLRSMAGLHRRTRSSVVSLVRVAAEAISSYGGAQVSQAHADGAFVVRGCVEKPAPGTAPSDLALSGRYVLESEVLEAIRRTGPDHGGEIQLTPALAASAESGHLLGLETPHTDALVDVGNWHGWLRANRLAFEREATAVASKAVA